MSVPPSLDIGWLSFMAATAPKVGHQYDGEESAGPVGLLELQVGRNRDDSGVCEARTTGNLEPLADVCRVVPFF